MIWKIYESDLSLKCPHMVDYVGTKEETSGKLFNGHIKCEKPNEELRICLKGIVKFNSKHRNIIYNQIKLLISSKDSYFEFLLPGNLPSSMKSKQVEISYELSVERKGIKSLTKEIVVKRHLFNSNLLMWENSYQSSIWRDILYYSLETPFKAYGKQDQINVNFGLQIIKEGYQVQSVSCVLKQYIHCKHPYLTERSLLSKLLRSKNIHDDKLSLKTNKKWSETVAHNRMDTFKEQLNELNLNLEVNEDILPSMDYIFEDQEIKIDHSLSVLITVVNQDLVPSQVLAKLPIFILGASSRSEEMEHSLPLYELPPSY